MPAAALMLRSLTLGLVSGGRSTVGIAALTWSGASQGRLHRPAAVLALPAARPAMTIAVAGELVADTLPQTPSRLDPPGLQIRVLAGAVCGAVLAQRCRRAALLPAVVGAAGAYAGSRLGAAVRTARPGLTTALAEDAVVHTAAWATTR
ncbi:MAG: hypothetical protein JWL64_684 [Frankiales bacterium]|nr:hypothetical protein [Frankiales bacterium]